MKKSKPKTWPYTSSACTKILGSIVIGVFSLVASHTSCSTSNRPGFHSDVQVEAYFTPDEPCMDLIIYNILSAKKLILVQAYVITSEKIVHALIKAHQGKVNVQLLVDKNAPTSKGSKIDLILQHGIPVIVDKTAGLSHNKIMIIDDEYVITGSFNWTNGAQTRNAENIVIIKGEHHNRKFKNNWYRRAGLGEKLKEKNSY